MSASQVRAAVEQAFRDFVVNGVPASGENEPAKSEIRYALGQLLETTLNSVGSGLLRYATVAAMNADTTQADGTLAYVFNNNGSASDPANGYYQWDDGGNAWEAADWYSSLLSAVEDRLEALEGQEYVFCGVLSTAGDVFDLGTAYNTGEMVPVLQRRYRFRVPGDYAGPANYANLKVTLNGSGEFPLYNQRGGFVVPEQLAAFSFVDIVYTGADFVIAAPALQETIPIIQARDLNTGLEYSFNVQTRSVDYVPKSGDRLQCQFIKTNQTQPMSLSVNGGTSLAIYEVDGTNPRPGRIEGGAQGGPVYTFLYVAAGDPLDIGGAPYWLVIDPPMNQQEREALTAMQLASQAMLALRKRWEADNLVAWEAMPRATVFDHTFDLAGDEDKYRYAAADGDYDPFEFTAGYIHKTFAADSLFWDPNHNSPGPGFLQLPLVLHPQWHDELVGITSFRDAKLTMTLQMLNFELPPGAILAWHYQAKVVPGDPGQSANYLYMGQLVSDAAGFGVAPNAGMGWPPVRRSRADTGDFNFTVRFIDDDAYWMQLGTSRARAAIGGTTTPLYTTRPISDAFDGTFQSSILTVLFPQQTIPTRAPQQAAKGTLRVKQIKLELPT